jgi:hypothetical protein
LPSNLMSVGSESLSHGKLLCSEGKGNICYFL